jgi:hypothetical protein
METGSWHGLFYGRREISTDKSPHGSLPGWIAVQQKIPRIGDMNIDTLKTHSVGLSLIAISTEALFHDAE